MLVVVLKVVCGDCDDGGGGGGADSQACGVGGGVGNGCEMLMLIAVFEVLAVIVAATTS